MIRKCFSEFGHRTFPIIYHGHSFVKSKPNVVCNITNFASSLTKSSLKMGSSSGKFQVTKLKGPETKQKHMASATTSSQVSATTKNDEYVEDTVCKTFDLIENEPQVFDLNEGKVLLIKQNGKISALGTKCTHYGAPLEKSAIGDGRLRCQWHGACFNISTGDIEDFPGLDSLPCYQVTIENENVKVRAKKSELKANKRLKTITNLKQVEFDKVVVIGGGPASAVCVETLRQEGFSGKITMVTKEKYIPYDRIKLSKALDAEINNLLLRNPTFYKDYNIEIINSTSATKVDTSKKVVTLSDHKTLDYDKLFIATGSKPRLPNLPGVSLKNIFILREYEDVERIASQISSDKEVVIIGSSFIGMEIAAFLAGKVKKVSIVGRSGVPFMESFGEKIGTAVMRMFSEKGVEFHMQTEVKEFKGNENGEISTIELNNGTVLPANFCVIGLGSVPNTNFLSDSGLTVNPNGTVEVNEYLSTNIQNIFAGGDIAKAPLFTHNNTKASIGHWGLAHYHGRIAALNILGKNAPLKTIPFFWTMLFGKSIRYAGHGAADEVFYTGDVDNLNFVAFYLKGDDVIAVSSCQMDPVVSQFAEYMIQGKRLTRKDLQNDPLGWTKQEF